MFEMDACKRHDSILSKISTNPPSQLFSVTCGFLRVFVSNKYELSSEYHMNFIRTLSRDCRTLSRDCRTLSRECRTLSRDCRTLSRDCMTLSRNCRTLSRDCRTQSRDCKILSRDCRT